MMSNKKIFVELTLGHRAVVRESPTDKGYTHDWEVYVRSDKGQIEAFVERVIFNIHETFFKPRRVVKEPPFVVKESGYAGFMINIEVYFKNKEEPKRADFTYDLYLQSEGPPISAARKEKLVFNYPTEEFAKKLFLGGGIIHKEKDHHRGDSSSSSSSYLSPHSGGKSSKHSSTNVAKSSPSFETLFGTPIKRGAPSLTTSTVSGSPNPSGPSKDPKPGSSAKSGKTVKLLGQANGGGKGEKMPSKSPAENHSGGKGVKSPLLDSPTGSEASTKSSYSKTSTFRRSSNEKANKSEKTMKMLPPENSAVPRKSKKPDFFASSPSSSSPPEKPSKKSEKSKKRSSKHDKLKAEEEEIKLKPSKVKVEVEDVDSYPSIPEVVTRKESKREPEAIVKRERIEKTQMSPMSSNSGSSSPSATSGSEANSEMDESEPESGHDEIVERSNKRIVAANSTSSPRGLSKQRNNSESGSEASPPGSPASSMASSCSSGPPSPPPPKRRKHSTSSSSLTPDHTRSHSPVEKPNSSSSAKVKKDHHHHHKREEKKHRKSRKKSKRHKKEAVEEDPHSSDSSIASVESYSAVSIGNGISSNGLSPSPAFNHSNSAGILTPEMMILQQLQARIHTMEDPEKLQEVVDIVVDSCERELWTMESGSSFDFDLCKLSSSTIRRIQEAILD